MRFDKFLKTALADAEREASDDGSASAEAHHLLLAIAASGEPSTRAVLASVGLDHAAIRAAIDRELEQSLAAAGVSLGAAGLPRPSHPRRTSPHPGSWLRLVMGRTMASAGTQGPRPTDLLLGVVLAPVGTVPRALALAGADPADLVARIHQSLGGGAQGAGR